MVFAGAMIVAVDGELTPVCKGACRECWIGTACGAKPTALLFAGVPTGLALLGMMPVRQWWRATVCRAIAGLIMLLPWMVRNWMACGNPLFPFALTVFGHCALVSGAGDKLPAAPCFERAVVGSREVACATRRERSRGRRGASGLSRHEPPTVGCVVPDCTRSISHARLSGARAWQIAGGVVVGGRFCAGGGFAG